MIHTAAESAGFVVRGLMVEIALAGSDTVFVDEWVLG